ncbi:hypothetical protein LIER_36284 [Lithospermum erythrorhizon]
MVEKGLRPASYTYHALIKGFMKRKRYNEAKEIFHEMRQQGLPLDEQLYSIFLDMNYNEGNFEMTLELCEEAVEKCLIKKTSFGKM